MPAFDVFRALARAYAEACAELRAQGYESHRFDCLPIGPWRADWESCTGIQVFGRHASGFLCVEKTLDRRPRRTLKVKAP